MSQSELLTRLDEARIPAVDEVFHQLGGAFWSSSVTGVVTAVRVVIQFYR